MSALDIDPELMSAATAMKMHIVETACQIASEQPFATVQTSEICKRANISRHTFYRYFRDKGEIAAFPLRIALRQNFGKIGRPFTWEDAMMNMIRAFEEYRCLNLGALSPATQSEAHQTIRREMRDFFLDALGRRGIEVGVELKVQVDIVSMSIADYVVEWARSGRPIPADDLARALASAVPSGLRDAMLRP